MAVPKHIKGGSRRKSTAIGKPFKAGQAKAKGKDHAFDRPTISIPVQGEPIDDEDQDVEYFRENGAGEFLTSLDHAAISRSKKELTRIRNLSKPVRIPRIDDLPSTGSHSETGGSWSEGDDVPLSEDDTFDGSDVGDASSAGSAARPSSVGSDEEQPYELLSRKRRRSWDEVLDQGSSRLPIKLADGNIKRLKGLDGRPAAVQLVSEESDTEDDVNENGDPERNQRQVIEDVSTGARFGRPALRDVISLTSRKERIQRAKEQIAGICQDIMADPENSLGLLRRLHTFSLPQISSPSHPEPISNDPLIRKLAFLSQLAVFKDVVPGYRIRALTEKEKEEKVSQMVMQTREWEQGLVGVYQSYLRCLEDEIKAKTDLGEVALRCICNLLTELTHFNFRTNLISVVVGRLSRKIWDEPSEMCRDTFISIFRNDLTGAVSLEVVRLLNRMIKERKFKVHPNVLTSLLRLRLKDELGVRVSNRKADAAERQNGATDRKKRGKEKEKPHFSKRAKKALKEKKEIQKELAEAEAEVDREERARTHTETLKLLFVLYFRILKDPAAKSLLPAALAGVASFAHLINVDFFKDLLDVLKDLIGRTEEAAGTVDQSPTEEPEPNNRVAEDFVGSCRMKLLCIVTAFELLSGQGEALEIDLSDFVNHLYALIMPLSFALQLEDAPSNDNHIDKGKARATAWSAYEATTADLLFRALSLLFMRHVSVAKHPPWRSAAFAKRLLTVCLSWPPHSILRALEFVRGLVVREPKLDALLSTEDRKTDGIYRPELDDPQLCNPFATSFWELTVLAHVHPDGTVRGEANKLARWNRSSAI